MKMRNVNLLLTTLAMIGVNLLVSCAQKGNGPSSTGANGSPIVTPQGGSPGPGTKANGTSDSGGGTGMNGKVFESYIVDPTQLPAYKQHLEVLLANIKSEKPDEPADYDKIFKIKTWYVAPIELDKISKDVLGVSFIKSDTQQIARQTSKEVWIDKRAYDAMNSQDQAKLLLHELVMNIYFFKFMTMTEMCRVSVMVMGEKNDDGCVQSTDRLDKAMPPENYTP